MAKCHSQHWCHADEFSPEAGHSWRANGADYLAIFRLLLLPAPYAAGAASGRAGRSGRTSGARRLPSSLEPAGEKCKRSASQAPAALGGTSSLGSANAATRGWVCAQAARRSFTRRREASQAAASQAAGGCAKGAAGGARATVRRPRAWHSAWRRRRSWKMSSGFLPFPRSLVPAMISTNSGLCSSRKIRRKPLPNLEATSRTFSPSMFATISAARWPLCPQTRTSHSAPAAGARASPSACPYGSKTRPLAQKPAVRLSP
mmetsp:Transcript_106/g.301  ORF Transcript_106/g.301 Transcript_106/m.301 type:complete len:260 (-) Transcript_106:139-918(-)